MPDRREDERAEFVYQAGRALIQVNAHLLDAWDAPDDYSIEEDDGPLARLIEQGRALDKAIDNYVWGEGYDD